MKFQEKKNIKIIEHFHKNRIERIIHKGRPLEDVLERFTKTIKLFIKVCYLRMKLELSRVCPTPMAKALQVGSTVVYI